MIIFYSTLITLCFFMVASVKVNTNNILNLSSIGLVIIGALLEIYSQYKPLAHPNYLIEFGVLIHFICEIAHYHKKQHRRAGDRKTT